MAMIDTFYNGELSQMDETVLEKRTGGDENENETWTWVEYWFDEQLVHRSVDMIKKTGVFGGLDAAGFF